MFRNGGKVRRALARLIYGHIFVLYVKWVCGKKCNALNLSEEIESPRKQYTSDVKILLLIRKITL